MATQLEQGSGGTQTEAAPLDDFAALLQKEFKPQDDAKASRIEQAVQTLAQQAMQDAAVIGDDVFTTLDAIRAAIDKKLTDQINQIIHHEDFQKLESAWRGLNYMVMNTSTGADLKIRVMNMSKEECRKMFRQFRDAAWDQSPLFKKVYESEFGQLGGQPFGAFVCDYQLRPFGARPGGAARAVEDRCRRARAIHRRRRPDAAGDAVVAGADQSARSGQAVRRDRLCRVALFPRHRPIAAIWR